jgi:hypothetical protein
VLDFRGSGDRPGPNGPVKLEHPSPPLRVKVMTCHSTLSTLANFKLFESQNGEDFKVEANGLFSVGKPLVVGDPKNGT